MIPAHTVAGRRLLVGCLWVAATAVATAVSFIGVSMVTASVIRPITPTVAQAAPLSPTGTVETVPPETTTTTAPAPPPAPPPVAPAPAPAATPPTTTALSPPPSPFRIRGGVAAVTCAGSAIRLASASPDNGYTLKVFDSGPERVDLAFVRDGEFNRLTAVCQNGTAVRVPSDTGGPGPTQPTGRDGPGGGFDGGRGGPSSGPGGDGSQYPHR